MRISDWSSDVCSSDLGLEADLLPALPVVGHLFPAVADQGGQLAPLQFRDLSGRKPLAGFMLAQVVQGAPSTHGLVAGVEEVAERSEERRVGKACVSTCRTRWAP